MLRRSLQLADKAGIFHHTNTESANTYHSAISTAEVQCDSEDGSEGGEARSTPILTPQSTIHGIHSMMTQGDDSSGLAGL